MIPADPVAPAAEERDDDLLTRAEASAYLERFQIRLKAQSLARIWSVGRNGPPCVHVRRKPWYPRGELRRWAQAQRTRLRRSAHDAETSRGPLD